VYPVINLSPEFRLTNRERKLQKLKDFSQLLYKLRGELAFLIGDFQQSFQSYKEYLKLEPKSDSIRLLEAMVTQIGKKQYKFLDSSLSPSLSIFEMRNCFPFCSLIVSVSMWL
jgi:hypothetical protein